MKKVLLFLGIFVFALGIACFTKEITGLLFPIAGFYYFLGIPSEPSLSPDEYFGIYSHVPYVLMSVGFLLIIISMLFPQKDKESLKKWHFKFPQFKKWKKIRTISQIIVLILIAGHIILYVLGITNIKAICPAALAIAAIKGSFGFSAIFWIFILLGTIFGGRFLCGWLCVFAPIQENADNILTAIGNKSKTKKQLNSVFIYFAALLFWGSIIYNIIMNINNLTFNIHSGTANPINNIWTYVGGLITIIPLTMFFTYLWGGRFFCRNVCPIGGLFKIYSKFSLFKIKIDTDKCNNCSACATNCQMNVKIDKYISSGNKSIKDSDCIVCGDCIDTCPKRALKFELL